MFIKYYKWLMFMIKVYIINIILLSTYEKLSFYVFFSWIRLKVMYLDITPIWSGPVWSCLCGGLKHLPPPQKKSVGLYNKHLKVQAL